MYMKKHILAALHEEFEQWETVLARLDETQITSAHPSALSIKDEIAHLWVWQQRTIARMEAGLHNREPEMPKWLPNVEPDAEDNTEQINAWIYDTYRGQPWATVYQNWRAGFLRLLALGEAIAEKALLDSSCYPWLAGYSLAFILVASYDHHQEHLADLLARLSPA